MATTPLPATAPEPAIAARPPRERLLGAAESIILGEGFSGLSTRAICGLAQTNISQIRYYFGSLDGLLDALLAEQLKSVARLIDTAVPAYDTLDLSGLVTCLIAAVRAPAAVSACGHAALIIEEIHHRAGADMRQELSRQLQRAHEPFISALAARVPHLSPDMLRYRLSGMIALVMSMLPAAPGARLFAATRIGSTVDATALDGELAGMCIGLLQYRC